MNKFIAFCTILGVIVSKIVFDAYQQRKQDKQMIIIEKNVENFVECVKHFKMRAKIFYGEIHGMLFFTKIIEFQSHFFSQDVYQTLQTIVNRSQKRIGEIIQNIVDLKKEKLAIDTFNVYVSTLDNLIVKLESISQDTDFKTYFIQEEKDYLVSLFDLKMFQELAETEEEKRAMQGLMQPIKVVLDLDTENKNK